MSYFNETSTESYNWDDSGVYVIEPTDYVEGGEDGVSNRQAKELTKRTRNLHTRMSVAEGEIDSLQEQLPISTEATLRNAKEYTDGAIAGVQNEMEVANANTLRTAKDYADMIVAALVDNTPEALNTLQELATALGNNPNFATDVLQAIGERATMAQVNAALAGKAGTNHSHSGYASVGHGHTMAAISDSSIWFDNKIAAIKIPGVNLLKVTAYTDLTEWTISNKLLGVYYNTQAYGGRYIFMQNTTPNSWRELSQTFDVKDNTLYVIRCSVCVYSGSNIAQIAVVGDSGLVLQRDFSADNKFVDFEITFNSGSNTSLAFKFWSTGASVANRGYVALSSVFIGEGNTAPAVWFPAADDTIPVATSTSNGLMSAADKTKLDGVDGKPKICGFIAANGAFQGTTRGVTNVEPQGTGIYRIYHKLNHTAYIVQVTSQNEGMPDSNFSVINIRSSYFDVVSTRVYSTPSMNNNDFTFVVFEY